jgi:hypothetical protein
MTVDPQVVARTISELRARLPEADDLLEGFQHLAQVARTVVAVDGAGLAVVHEDGPPRWVATTRTRPGRRRVRRAWPIP